MACEPTFTAEVLERTAAVNAARENFGTTPEAVDELLEEIIANSKKPIVPVIRPAWMNETPTDEPIKPMPSLGAAVISFILDFPDVVVGYIDQMKWEFFDPGPQWIVAGCIHNYLEEFQCIPTREALADYIFQQITIDDSIEEIREIVMRPSNPRETPFIRQELVKWMKQQAYKNALYSDQSVTLITEGHYAEFHKALDEAASVGQIKNNIIGCDDLLDTNAEYNWIVENVLLADQPMIVGGAAKTLKTSISMDMALSIAAGGKFLGRYKAHKRRVLFISGESGKGALANTIKAIAHAREMTRDDFRAFIHFSFRLPRLTNASDIGNLKRDIEKRKIDVVFIDPLYMCLLQDSKLQAGNLFDMGNAFSGICNACQDVGCTPVFLHHFNRKGSPFARPTLSDLTQAGSSEFCRQHILISRQKAYAADGIHDLYLVLGREGGCEHLDVRITETDAETKSRIWRVESSVSTVVEKEAANVRKDRQMLVKVNEVLKIIADLMKDKKETTSNAIKKEAGLNGSTMKEILEYGVNQSLIDVSVSEKTGNNNYFPAGVEVEQ